MIKKLLIIGSLFTSAPAFAQDVIPSDYSLPREEIVIVDDFVETPKLVEKQNVRSMTPYFIAMHLSAAADIYTTHRCVNVKRTCHEGNSWLYGKYPSLEKLVLIRGGLSALTHIGLAELAKNNPREAKTAAVTITVIGFTAAGLNMRF